MSRSPVFIVGSPRSGTSMMVDLLICLKYTGFREGSFLPILHGIETVIDRQYAIFAAHENKKILIGNLDKNAVKSALFGSVKQMVADKHEGPWFDKTGNPDMIFTLPILKDMWPDAAFIFCKRRGLENVNSRLKKFPQHAFEFHCKDWNDNMAAWRRVRESLPSGSHIEVDQQDMLRNSEHLASKLTTLLKVEGDQCKLADVSRTTRPQQTSEGSAERILNLDTIDWSESQRGTFRRLCGGEMEAYGYTFDDTYWNKSEPPQPEASSCVDCDPRSGLHADRID